MNEENVVKERTDSIKVSKTAKGDYTWEIKMYYDPKESSPIEVILNLKEVDLSLKKEFGGQQ